MTIQNDFEIVVLDSNAVADLEKISTLFGKAFKDPETYSSKCPSAIYLKSLLESDTFIALAARLGGKMVGGLIAYELKKFEQERSEIYIYDLAVDEEHRRKRIATALIDYLNRLAISRNAWVVYVQADHEDTPAIELYSKMGKRGDVLHFDIKPEKA